MAEYIEREAVMSDIGETVIFTVREGAQLPNAEMRGANKVIDRIKAAPAADVVEVRHGCWLVIENRLHLDVKCSVCKSSFYVYKQGQYRIDQSNYCPKCGAKMDGKGENDVGNT